MIDVTIIIVSYNTKNLTLQCIKSILEEGSRLKKEIIVVDNGSKDGSVEELRRIIKDIKSNKGIRSQLIENKDNLGFAKANNQAIKVARGKYILLLNSDAKVKEGSIGKLVDFAEETSNVGVVGPRLLNPDGSIQPSAFRLPTIKRALKQYWFDQKGLLDKYSPITKHHSPVTVEAIVMAAFLITPSALRKVGLLNERYFMYYEDFDYCKRVLESGFNVWYLPTAEVVHYHGASGKALTDEKNQWRRLIPSSKIYHGKVKHYLINFIIWSGQKWEKLIR